jgi:hypothetical protein
VKRCRQDCGSGAPGLSRRAADGCQRMSHGPPGGEESPRPGPAPHCAFTPSEYASLALLRRAIEAGAYNDDLTPPGTALDGRVAGALHAAARLGGSAGHSPRRKQKVDGEILIACLNGAGIVAAIVAAMLGRAAV